MGKKNITKNAKQIKTNLENELMKAYEYEILDKELAFEALDGSFVRLDILGDNIIIEWAENKEEAKNNRFEDGDWFGIHEYNTGEILQAVFEILEEENKEE